MLPSAAPRITFAGYHSYTYTLSLNTKEARAEVPHVPPPHFSDGIVIVKTFPDIVNKYCSLLTSSRVARLWEFFTVCTTVLNSIILWRATFLLYPASRKFLRLNVVNEISSPPVVLN